MDAPWQFSVVNACFTVLVVGATHLLLLRKLQQEFSDRITALMTAPVAESQIASRLVHIEEMVDEMRARMDRNEERMRRLLEERFGLKGGIDEPAAGE